MRAASASPIYSESSDAYLAIKSPAEIETVDTNTGAVIGSPVSLEHPPVALGEWYDWQSAPSQLVVAETWLDSNYQHVSQLEQVQVQNGAVTGPISLPDQATGLVVSSAKAYAIVLEPSADEVSVYDIKTESVVGSVSLGLSAGDTMSISINPDGEQAYVADETSHQVVVLSYQSTSPYFAVSSTYTGSSGFDPSSITISHSGDTAYVSDGSAIDLYDVSSGGFSSLSTSISLSVAAGQSVVSQDDASLYVDQQSSTNPEIAVVDLTDDSVSYRTSPLDPGPLLLTNDGAELGVADTNTATFDLLKTGGSGATAASVALDGVAVAAVRAKKLYLDNLAYVALSGTNQLAVVDPVNQTLNDKISTASTPEALAMSPDGTYLYVADYGADEVQVVDVADITTSTPPVVATISLPTGGKPDALAMSPDGDRLLVADSGTGEVSVIDTNPEDSSLWSLLANVSLSTATDPSSIAISPNGQYAYVTDAGSGEVSVLQGSSGTWSLKENMGSLGFAGEPEGIALSPDGRSAWVSDSGGYLDQFLIDPANGTLYTTSNDVSVGTSPAGVALSPRGTTAYVENTGSHSVSVLDTASGKVTSTLSTAATPGGIALTPDSSTLLQSNDGTGGDSVSLFATSGGSLEKTISLGSGSSPAAIVVSPAFDRPGGGSPVGTEQDVNPAVAATSQGIDLQDGVDTATGAYLLSLDDLSLPDVGLGLDLSQTYDSANAEVQGPLGKGWSFSYGMSVSQVPAGSGATSCEVTITQENGSEVVFSPPPGSYPTSCPDSATSAAYQPAPFEQASLSVVSSCHSGNACWLYTRAGTTKFYFDQTNGELVYIKDDNANTVTLAYSSGELQSVTGQSGSRSLSFTWSGSNITKVTDSAGRTATFTYGSTGNLQKIVLDASSTGDTKSHTWLFTYDSSNQLMDWWSPDNQATKSSDPCTGTASSSDHCTAAAAYNAAGLS